jgi:hypothetical protein
MGADWVRTKNILLCSDHFETTCYMNPNKRPPKLVWDGVPSIFDFDVAPVKLPRHHKRISRIPKEAFLAPTDPPLKRKMSARLKMRGKKKKLTKRLLVE